MKPLIDNFPDILKSALLTIELTVLSILTGLVIGFIFALMRISRNKLLFYWSKNIWANKYKKTNGWWKR